MWPWLVSITVELEFISVPWQLKLICLVDTGSDPCPRRRETLTELKHSNWQGNYSAPAGKRMTLILLSEITLTAQDDRINIFFNLDFYLQLTAGGNKIPDRRRQAEVKWKTKESEQVGQHLGLFHEHRRLHWAKPRYSLFSSVLCKNFAESDFCKNNWQ